MKNKYYSFLLLFSVLFAISSCEKDDICASGTPVTPRLIIEFYDAIATTAKKNVSKLAVAEPSFTKAFSFDAVSKIQVPLRNNATTTTLNFIQNGSDNIPTNNNIVALTFNYETQDFYVSRACGYKTLFYGLTVTPTVYPTDYWIKNVIITKSNIENENEVHLKIYF